MPTQTVAAGGLWILFSLIPLSWIGKTTTACSKLPIATARRPSWLGKNTTPIPARAPGWGEYDGGTIWIVPAGKNTYQAELLTRL
jgi:hypothetical protein